MSDLSSRDNKKTYRHNPDIPHELMLNIFTRLPPKSLFRFKCVCKDWLALFQDETFMDSYAFHRRQQVVNLLGRKGKWYVLYSLDKTGMIATKIPLSFVVSEWYTFASACNGLFCLPIDGQGLMVWNPITNESIYLPESEPYRGEKKFLGFGFDIVSNKFKVIRSYTLHEIQVLTVGDQEWRNVGGGSLNGERHILDKIIYLNGSLHWLTRMIQGGLGSTITSFNLGDESFRMLPIPGDGVISPWHSLCEFEGCLCFIGFDGSNILDLWLWIGNEEKWINQRISLPFEIWKTMDSVTHTTRGEILVKCSIEDCYYLCCYEYDKQQRQNEIQLVKVTKFIGIDMVVNGKHDDNIVSFSVRRFERV
ncbi:hypothetical protein ACHQM5_029521 [Ranunculus cassubicifolius]